MARKEEEGLAIKFREEQVRAEVLVAREVVKDVISGDIELRNHDPGYQVSEVLDVKAQIRDIKSIIVDGGVEVNGIVVINIIYNAEVMDEENAEMNSMEKEIRANVVTYHQEAKIEFENFIDIPEAESGMQVILNIRIADISYEVLETDMLEIAVTLIKYCALSEIRDIRCITQLSGLMREEVIEEQIQLEEWIGDERIRTTISKELELNEQQPEINEVITVVGEVVKTEYKTMDNSVSYDGVMEVSVLYRTSAAENELNVLNERIEFSQVLELSNVETGMNVVGSCKIIEISVQTQVDGRVRIISHVESYLKVSKPRRLNVITDILNDKIDTEKVTIVMEEVVGQNRARDSIIHRINVPPTRPDIIDMVQYYSRIKDLTTIVNSGGIIVEGSLEGTVYYLAEEDYYDGNLTVCLKDYFDFDNFLAIANCEEGMDIYLETEVRRTSCQILNARTIEMNVTIEKWVKVTSKIEIDCVVDLVEISPILEEMMLPTYIVYVVQKGDTLYKIAKRYRIDLEALIEVNNIENPDDLQIGQKIIIPKTLIGVME